MKDSLRKRLPIGGMWPGGGQGGEESDLAAGLTTYGTLEIVFQREREGLWPSDSLDLAPNRDSTTASCVTTDRSPPAPSHRFLAGKWRFEP